MNKDHAANLDYAAYSIPSARNSNLDSIVLQKERLTCANHTDKEVLLDQIGWNSFTCPKCGHDYSIGRKIAISEHSREIHHNLDGNRGKSFRRIYLG